MAKETISKHFVTEDPDKAFETYKRVLAMPGVINPNISGHRITEREIESYNVQWQVEEEV